MPKGVPVFPFAFRLGETCLKKLRQKQRKNPQITWPAIAKVVPKGETLVGPQRSYSAAITAPDADTQLPPTPVWTPWGRRDCHLADQRLASTTTRRVSGNGFITLTFQKHLHERTFISPGREESRKEGKGREKTFDRNQKERKVH